MKVTTWEKQLKDEINYLESLYQIIKDFYKNKNQKCKHNLYFFCGTQKRSKAS